jgi:hypothetical protein
MFVFFNNVLSEGIIPCRQAILVFDQEDTSLSAELAPNMDLSMPIVKLPGYFFAVRVFSLDPMLTFFDDFLVAGPALDAVSFVVVQNFAVFDLWGTVDSAGLVFF